MLSSTSKNNISNNIIGLAPMEGVTCLASRLWFSQTSYPDFAMTPFLRVTRDYPWKRVASTYAAEIFDLKKCFNYDLIPQLMGTSPEDLERIATPLLSNTSFVDINCGCPSPKVVGSHAGSGLLEKSEVFSNFVNGLESRLGEKKFSIKMRSGFTSDEEFPELLKIVAHAKISQLTLHARTRKDRYTGKARWNLIHAASQECSFPIVGSGDITDFKSFQKLSQQAPNLNKFIIGRGALRNPWIFKELREKTSVTISNQVLITSLATFAILQELVVRDSQKLFNLIERGDFLSSCDTNEERWENLYHKLSNALFGDYIPTAKLNVERASFARVKMIWNSLRSSLPEKFMEPTLLRSACFSDFAHSFMGLCEKKEILLPLEYKEQFDWIYSGAKNHEHENQQRHN
ncbi:tRNA-dihydrouridine synthase family protein [Fluviispira multicolorata]|uniref:tRNA-dihydrouridine synthase family protein n=1 Tax=Fluviispira multicolorata TaxID=2654512 RepID=UPI001375E3ED|nr:tRNA-dihydrouridine synthase family protein [Fluviispira multicolorata]